MAIERISINIRSNIRQIKSELADVDSELKSLQKLKIDLNLQVRSDRLKEVKKEISDIDIDIKKLQANRAELRISDLQADKAKKKVQEINYEIGKLRSKKAKLQVEAQELKGADTQLNKINRRLEQLDHKKTRLQIDLDDAYETTKSLGRLKTSLAYINATKSKINISSNIEQVGQKLDTLGGKMLGVANKIGLAAGAATAYLGAKALSVFGEYEQTMNMVGAVTGAASGELEGLSEKIKQLGADSVFSANEVGQAALELAKGGLSTAQLQAGALENTINLAAASGMGMEESAIALSNAMNSFGIEAGKTNEIVNAFAGGANASSADVKDLTMALAQVGAGAVNAGMDLNETVAALAMFADNGIKGSDAGTSLKTMLANLVPSTDTAAQAMEKYGLSFQDASGNMDGMATIADKLQKSLGGLSEAERVAALNAIFGSDASRAASIFMRQGAGSLNAYIEATQDLTAAQRLSEAYMKGWRGTLEQASGSIETLAITAGEKLSPAIAPLIQAFGELADKATDFLTENEKTVEGWSQALGTAIQNISDKIREFKWGDFFSGLSEGAKDAVSFFSPVAGFIKGMITWLGDGSLEKGLGKLPALFLKTAVAAKVLGKALKIFGKVSDFKLPSLFGKKNEGEDGGGFQFNFDAGKMLNQVKNVALVYGVVKAVSAAAQALKDISDKVPSDTGELAPKLANMAIAIGGMGAFIVAAGKLAEKDPVAAVAGIASIAFIEGELILAAEAVRQISDKVPSDIGGFAEKMANVAIAIGGMGALVAAGGVLASMNMVAAVAGLAAVALISVDLMAAAEAVKQINGKVPGDIAKFADKMANMAIAIGGMEAIVFAVGALMATGIGALIEGAGLATVAALAAELMGVSEAIGELEEKVPDDFSEVEGKINTVAEVIEHITASNLGDAFNFFENTVSAWNISAVSAGVDNMVSLAGKLEELAAIEIPDGIQGKINGIEEVLKEFDGTGLKELFKSVVSADNIKALEAYAASIKNIGGTLESLDDISFDKDKAVGNIRDIRDTVTQISDTGGIMFSINASSLGTAYDAVQDILGIGYKLNTIAQGVTFDPETASKKIAHIQDAIKKIGDTGFVETINMETVKEKIDTFYGIAQKVKSLGGLEMDMEKIRTAISGVDEAVGNINAISSDVNLEAAEKLVESFETLIDDLNGLADKFTETGTDYGNGIYAGFDGADPRGSMAAEIDGAVTDLGEKESQFSKTGKAYGDAMNKSFGAAVAGMADKVSGQLAAITEYVASFGDLGMRLGDSLRNGFNIAIGNMKSDMALQVSQMQSMANSLSLPSTGSRRYGFASGGEVPGYYAKGGYARPKGTDTVPAMLTPGEFVQSRKAVGTFGRDFMQRVNSLDMQGALRSLAYRFNPHTMAIPSVSNVVNHVNNSSYQNNAKIVQNIQGGNPDYCMRRASRYLNKR